MMTNAEGMRLFYLGVVGNPTLSPRLREIARRLMDGEDASDGTGLRDLIFEETAIPGLCGEIAQAFLDAAEFAPQWAPQDFEGGKLDEDRVQAREFAMGTYVACGALWTGRPLEQVIEAVATVARRHVDGVKAASDGGATP